MHEIVIGGTLFVGRRTVDEHLEGARTVEQIEENLGAADVESSDDRMERLNEANGGPYAGL